MGFHIHSAKPVFKNTDLRLNWFDFELTFATLIHIPWLTLFELRPSDAYIRQ